MRLDFAACRRVSMALRTSRGQFAMNHDMHENIDLPLSVGAIAMSASTMIVAANAQLLRRLRLRHEPSSGPPLSGSVAPATLDSATR